MALNQNPAGPGQLTGVRHLCFFDLPRELRDQIYDLAYEDVATKAHDCACRTLQMTTKAPKIFLVNRQVRQEFRARPIIPANVQLTFTDKPGCEARHRALFRAITKHDTILSAVSRTATRVHLNLLIREEPPLTFPPQAFDVHRDDYSRWTQMQWIQRLLPQLPGLRELSIQVDWVADQRMWTTPHGLGARDEMIRAMRGRNARPSPSWTALPHLKRLKIRWISSRDVAHRNDLRKERGITWCPETDEFVDYLLTVYP